jgi:DNA-binding transcriptional MerR regulator
VSQLWDTLVAVKESMTLAEVAEASGLPARTIRFYIARGLLSGPVKGGRSAAYTAEHLASLDLIKRLQSEGRTLADIARTLGGDFANSSRRGESAAVPATPWWQHTIADDIIVWVRAGAAPWRIKQIRAALDEFARQVATANNEREKEQGIK